MYEVLLMINPLQNLKALLLMSLKLSLIEQCAIVKLLSRIPLQFVKNSPTDAFLSFPC